MMFNLVTTVYANGGQSGEGGATGMLISLLPFILIFVLMYFMMIRPQKKQQKEMQKMLANLEVGDKVSTIGGICGKIAKIKDDYVWIITGKNTDEAEKSCIKFERGAIKSVDKKIEE